MSTCPFQLGHFPEPTAFLSEGLTKVVGGSEDSILQTKRNWSLAFCLLQIKISCYLTLFTLLSEGFHAVKNWNRPYKHKYTKNSVLCSPSLPLRSRWRLPPSTLEWSSSVLSFPLIHISGQTKNMLYLRVATCFPLLTEGISKQQEVLTGRTKTI